MSSFDDVINSTTLYNDTLAVDPTRIFGPQRDSLVIVLPITIIYSLIFITGLLGNIFTCLVIVRNKSMHTATNYYLFSLAISDLLLLISGMPQEMYSIWSKWPYVFGHSFCVLRGLAAEASTNASVLTITLFTIERYLAICHPFVSHKMSKLSRAMKHIMLLWVVALGLALPQALQFGIKEHRGVTMCLQTRVIIEHSFEISTFFFFLAPMIVITVLYSLIGLKLRETSISKDQNQKTFERTSIRYTHKIQRKHSQSTRRVIKMLIAVVVAFFVCWAPFHAQRLVAIYGTNENHLARSPILLSVYSFVTYISGVFYYMSTCINPIFYHIMSNKFRDAFKNTMIQWCCRSSENTAAAKRCSYTAMAFARNPTSSGIVNSGNSMRNSMHQDASLRYKMKRQDSRERTTGIPTVHLCHNGKAVVSPPTHDYSNNYQSAAKHELRNNRNDYFGTSMCVANDKLSPTSPICSAYLSSPTETITVIPDAIAPEGEKDYMSDEPEKYLNEIKLRIIQREKEYG